MIDNKMSGNRPDECFVSETMGANNPLSYAKRCISPRSRPRPNPAGSEIGAIAGNRAVEIDVPGKAHYRVGVAFFLAKRGVAVTLPAMIVHSAPATKVMRRAVAFWNATLKLHRELNLPVAIGPDASTSRALFVRYSLTKEGM